jgi:BASS family bile acid:Na+ symporter
VFIPLKWLSQVSRRYFVVIVGLATVLGYFSPGSVQWMGWSTKLPMVGTINGIMIGLGIIMFGMGMTLSISQVRDALLNPGAIAIGVAFQFLLMPLIAFLLVISLGLDPLVGLGVILLGCCPGGTASNVMAFLAEADVPLSIAITLAGTLLAPLLTPWLFWFYGENLLGLYLGESIDVPVLMLAKATVIVVVPVLVGLGLKVSLDLGNVMELVNNLLRLVSIAIIALVVAYIVSTVDFALLSHQVAFIALPVIFHNGLGLITGYGAARSIGLTTDSVRTMTLEVGMQNSGLAMALAGLLKDNLIELSQYTSVDLALLSIPAVLFSVWHNVTGPLLASRWGTKTSS